MGGGTPSLGHPRMAEGMAKVWEKGCLYRRSEMGGLFAGEGEDTA